MPGMRRFTEINLTISSNPHRFGSMDFRRFELIQAMPAPRYVGEYIRRHNALGNVGTTANARRYLRYMVERGQMELPGVTFARRAPRFPVALATVAPISAELADFTFGCEIECYLPRGVAADDVARNLTDAGIDTRVEALSHGTRSWWKIVTDGSLVDYTSGREIVSPILRGQDGLAQVEKVCRYLTSIGCNVNTRCGFHVHVGNEANGNNAAYFGRLLQMYAWNETAIDQMVALSRRGPAAGSGFCGAVRAPAQIAATVQEVCRSVGATGGRSTARYRKLNVDCWWSQRTVEFRQHQGTVDADKACNWIQFCLHFCRFAASGQELPRNVSNAQLLATLGLSAELQAYFAARVASLAERPTAAAA